MFERVIGVGVLVGVVYLMALAGMPHKSVQTLTPVAPLSVTSSEPHTSPVSGFGLQAAQIYRLEGSGRVQRTFTVK